MPYTRLLATAEMPAEKRVCAGWVACPVHGARFDLATGVPVNPPATSPIVTFPARVIEDWVEVVLD